MAEVILANVQFIYTPLIMRTFCSRCGKELWYHEMTLGNMILYWTNTPPDQQARGMDFGCEMFDDSMGMRFLTHEPINRVAFIEKITKEIETLLNG